MAGIVLLAQVQPGAAAAGGLSTPLLSLVAVLAGLALLPFLLTMLTSFAKLVIVGGLIRQALGTHQVPPTVVITGLALIVSIQIMWPVGAAMGRAYDEARAAHGGGDPIKLVEPTIRPMVVFLERHSEPRNVALFERLRSQAAEADGGASAEDAGAGFGLSAETTRALTVLAPAFVVTELTEAFQIGFLIFVPFLIIDLFVSNVLLALGMQMLTPVTVSMPLKIMLFVLVDGWSIIIQGLVLGYR